MGHLARDCPKGKSSQGSDGRDPKDKRQLNTCYNCHQQGHKSTECPNNALCCEDQSRERRQENERGSYRTGRDNNQLVHDVVLDTGASRTMVRKEMVSEDDLTLGRQQLFGVPMGMLCSIYPLAIVEILVENYTMEVEAAVSTTLPVSVLVGTDIPKLKTLLQGEDECMAVMTRSHCQLRTS